MFFGTRMKSMSVQASDGISPRDAAGQVPPAQVLGRCDGDGARNSF